MLRLENCESNSRLCVLCSVTVFEKKKKKKSSSCVGCRVLAPGPVNRPFTAGSRQRDSSNPTLTPFYEYMYVRAPERTNKKLI